MSFSYASFQAVASSSSLSPIFLNSTRLMPFLPLPFKNIRQSICLSFAIPTSCSGLSCPHSCSVVFTAVSQVFTLPASVLEPACSREQPGSSYKAAVDQHIRTEVTRGHGELAADAVSRLSLQASTCKPEHKVALEELFSSLKTLTAKQDMLHTLR